MPPDFFRKGIRRAPKMTFATLSGTVPAATAETIGTSASARPEPGHVQSESRCRADQREVPAAEPRGKPDGMAPRLAPGVDGPFDRGGVRHVGPALALLIHREAQPTVGGLALVGFCGRLKFGQ